MPISVQECPVNHARPPLPIPPVEISGVTRNLLSTASTSYIGDSLFKKPEEKMAERYAKKLRWLSKLAGWSGHAALMDCCPEYGAASFSS